MAKNTFAYLQNTAFLGGIGTGCLKLYADGGTQFAGLSKSSSKKAHPGEHTDPVSFAICVRSSDDRINGSVLKNPEADSDTDALSLPHAPLLHIERDFPFTSVSYGTSSYGIAVTLHAFNPLIPHNSIDSGIPAAFFEAEITNTSDAALTVSFAALLKSFFLAGTGSPCYDKQSGAFYTLLSETSPSVAARRRGSICLASDSADFTYEISEDAKDSEFFERFVQKGGFLSDTTAIGVKKNISAILAFHLHLEPGQTEKRRFTVAWSFPYCAESPAKSGEKNYYCHYFSNLSDCVSYTFTHFDRLRRESALTRELAGEDTCLPGALKPLMRASLAAVKDPAVRRDAAGILKGISEENENTLLPVSFAFEYLFPGITTQTSVFTLKNLMTAKGRVSGTEFLPSAFDTDLNAAQITARFRLIMRLFYAYRTCSELRFYTENWVDISLMADLLTESAERLLAGEEALSDADRIYDALLPALGAMAEMADLLRDKKRKLYYIGKSDELKRRFAEKTALRIEHAPLRVLSSAYAAKKMCSFALYTQDELQHAAEKLETLPFDTLPPDFFACAMLAELKKKELCEKLSLAFAKHSFSCKKDLYASAVQVCALIPAFSGFDYDKNAALIAFSPEESLMKDGVFAGFVSFDGAYGRVELGADYIELILYSGEVKVKKAISPHRTYRVMFAGRYRDCDIDNRNVTLDSTLSVTKEKKLTLLIDLTK